MSLAAIGTADMDWRDDRSSVSPAQPRGLRFPVAVSLALHFGVAASLLAGVSPQRDAVSTGDPKAIEIMIVHLQKPAAPAPVPAEAAPRPPSRSHPAVAKAESVERQKPAAVAERASPSSPSKTEVRKAAAPASFPSSLPSSATSAAYREPAYGAAASPAATAGSSDGPERIFVTEARYRSPPTPPRYPKRARDLNQQGEALVRVRLDGQGNAEEILIWKSSGFALLDNAALAAVRRWQFEPARRNGMPVIAWVQIPVRFSLN